VRTVEVNAQQSSSVYVDEQAMWKEELQYKLQVQLDRLRNTSTMLTEEDYQQLKENNSKSIEVWDNEDDEASHKKQNLTPDKPTFEQLFKSFRRRALSQAFLGDGLCLEMHMYELLDHFGEELLHTLYDEMCASLYDDTKGFGEGVTNIENVIYMNFQYYLKLFMFANCIVAYKSYIKDTKNKSKKKGSKMDCARKLVALTANRPEAEASVLSGLATL
ncbi:hypothetical protein EC973_007279, partial [Apophysomyces ossiformis]